MSPSLPLAALLILAAFSARAQSRVGVVEAGVSNTGSPGSLSSTLSGGGAPQLITLNLPPPTLALTPTALAPSPAIAASPFAPAAPIAALPASAIAPAFAQPVVAKSAAPPVTGARAAAARALLGATPQDLEKTPVEELIAYTKRLFGESEQPGFESRYLRPGAPLEFGSQEIAGYRAALSAPGAKRDGERLTALVDAADALAVSAGIAVERVERARSDGTLTPALRIAPDRNGHRLNRLAWDLNKNFDSVVEYAPDRTDGGVAAYNSTLQILFLPDFGRADSFEAILHESRHAAFTKRLKARDISVFHASLVAYPRRMIAPGASSYTDYMSFEELSTHAKTLLHDILRAQHDGGGKGVSDARSDAYQFADILRSAQTNLFQLQRLGNLKSYRLNGDSWPLIPGGHWEAVNLPHAIMVVPVLDGPPAPKRGLWSRLFKDDPESPAVLVARRHAEALRPLVATLSRELETFFEATKPGAVDLKKARAAAVRMTSLTSEADKAFAASPY